MSDDQAAPPGGDLSSQAIAPRAQTDALLLTVLLKHQRQAWRRGERAPIESYLAQYPALSADVQAVLDLIYNEIVLREQIGESPEFEEYAQRFPELSHELARQFDLERAFLEGMATCVPEQPTAVDVHLGTRGPIAVPVVAGYEIFGELGRGGMGVVYKARQLRLNRVVALKMILAGEHASPETSLRFMAEAESIARLHHPHIVQIFAFGDCGGRPYFEMEYVSGGSLSDRLGGAPGPARDAARLVETAARAIHEAHQLGIVHRDLKPANILLTDAGTPKIVDFGLAKCLETDIGLTRSDGIVGSPNYMAPEQAEGRGVRIGPAADVYSLGAILYALLTGRPPFQATTIWETLEQVRFDEPMAPSRLRARLPRDLDTICLKCLQKDPARRYATAAELADDLARFAIGQTIRARPVGSHERLWRWCRREPAMAALGLALIGGFVGVATQWRRAESHLGEANRQRRIAEGVAASRAQTITALETARNLEAQARSRAQARFDEAIKTLRQIDELANEPELRRDPLLERLRRKFLNTSLEFYRQVQASLESDASPEARLALSAAYARVADLSWELGLNIDALAAHRRALTLLEHIAAKNPADPKLRSAIARGHSRIGFTLRTGDRLIDALRSYGFARDIQEGLVQEFPDSLDYRASLSWTISNIGLIKHELGQIREAIRTHRRAVAMHEALINADPTSGAIRSDLAWARRYLAQALAADGESEDALRLLSVAATDLELLAQARNTVEDGWRLARCRDEIGSILIRTRRGEGAVELIEQSREVLESLSSVNPALYRMDVARNLIYAASLSGMTARPENALRNLERAQELLNQCSWVPPAILYEMACAYSLWSGAESADADWAAGRKSRGDRAMAALRTAVRAGFRGPGQIGRDPTLDALRARDDFRQMFADWAFPLDVFEN
jgi:serine/threonine-protein kinase